MHIRKIRGQEDIAIGWAVCLVNKKNTHCSPCNYYSNQSLSALYA